MTETTQADALPGFDQPLAVLRTCHDAIVEHCELLADLNARLRASGPDAEARRTAEKISRYFSTSAALHQRDEEEDLFPRLNRQSLKIAELIHGLKKEHARLETLWTMLAPVLKRLPGEGFGEETSSAVEEFCSLYAAHIARENRDFLPLVANSLSQQELVALGESMAERRGIRLTAG